MDQPALLNQMTREMHGHVVTDNEGMISKLLNENTMEKTISNTWGRMWSKFTSFGSVSAGIFMVIAILQGIKMILGVFIKGYVLLRIYGWSSHLWSALWGSLATLFIALGQERYQQAPQRNPDPEVPAPPPEERYVHAPAPSFPARSPKAPSALYSRVVPKATYSVLNENSHVIEQTTTEPVRFSF